MKWATPLKGVLHARWAALNHQVMCYRGSIENDCMNLVTVSHVYLGKPQLYSQAQPSFFVACSIRTEKTRS